MHCEATGHKMSSQVSRITLSRLPVQFKNSIGPPPSPILVRAPLSIFGQRPSPFSRGRQYNCRREKWSPGVSLNSKGIQMSASAKSVLVPIATGSEEMEAVGLCIHSKSSSAVFFTVFYAWIKQVSILITVSHFKCTQDHLLDID